MIASIIHNEIEVVLFRVVQGALSQVMSLRQWSTWVTPVSGIFLVGGGTYALLSRVVPS